MTGLQTSPLSLSFKIGGEYAKHFIKILFCSVKIIMNLKEQIRQYKLENPDKGYASIAKHFNLKSHNSVRYHLDDAVKINILKSSKQSRQRNVLKLKIKQSIKESKKQGVISDSFNDLFKYFSTQEPICNLSGVKFNINDSSAYELDHKIPYSRGGTNQKENLQFTIKSVNRAKHSLLEEEFVSLCNAVSKFMGNGHNEN